jgi:predicted RNA-binding Zn-ribbon protein involved in translation (DUF1610 family)
MSEIKRRWYDLLCGFWLFISSVVIEWSKISVNKADVYAELATGIYQEGATCSTCDQTEWHSGEYPCPECGRPTLWDEEPKRLIHSGEYPCTACDEMWGTETDNADD